VDVAMGPKRRRIGARPIIDEGYGDLFQTLAARLGGTRSLDTSEKKRSVPHGSRCFDERRDKVSKCLPDEIDVMEEKDAAKTQKVMESPQ
jgi:hypothetical protein